MSLDWYSVKALFRWYFRDGGETARVEERVVLFRAGSFEQALDLAESEGRAYCIDNPEANYRIEPAGWWHAYWIGEAPGHGVEVFSRGCATDLGAKAFVRRYYPRSHEHTPHPGTG
jgi:hypothetical protein